MTNQKNITAPDRTPETTPVSEEAILKVVKEIAVKFIEVGRLTPGNFGETFQEIYKSVRDTVRSS